jgi:hypothetical protein
MNESESVRLVQGVGLDISTSVAETMRQAGALDGSLGADCISRTARQAVAAWAMAVEGDDTALAAIAGPDAVHWLMHADQGRWEVARGPRVTQIQVSALEPDGEPPRLRIYFEFVGRRQFTDPAQAENADGDPTFVGLLTLTLADSGPWHLESGHVGTLDHYLGYVFTSSRETAEGCHRRTGSSSAPAAASGPVRRYRIIAGFAEHDERFGSRAEVEVQREAAPTRYEAVDLVWPAVDEETSRALGKGDWQPSLLWVDVVELLEQVQAADSWKCQITSDGRPPAARAADGR